MDGLEPSFQPRDLYTFRPTGVQSSAVNVDLPATGADRQYDQI